MVFTPTTGNTFTGGLGGINPSLSVRKVETKSESFPGLTSQEKADIMEYVKMKYKTKSQQDLEANKIYSQMIAQKKHDKYNEDRNSASQTMRNMALDVKDPKEKQGLTTKYSTGEIAKLIRDDVWERKKIDLKGVDDNKVVGDFLKANPKAQKGLNDVINGKADVTNRAIKNGLLKDSSISKSEAGSIKKNLTTNKKDDKEEGLWIFGKDNADILGRHETKEYNKDASLTEKAGTFAENLGKSLLNMGSDLGNLVLNPLDTVNNLAKTGVGTVGNIVGGVQSAFGVDEENQLDNIMARQGGWLGDANEVSDVVGQAVVERYGSLEKFAKTLYEDPAGVISDIASLFEGGGGLVKNISKGVVKTATKKGATKVASIANKVGDVAETVEKVGKYSDPANIVSTTKGAIKGTKKILTDGPMNTVKDIAQETVDTTKKVGSAIKDTADTTISKAVNSAMGIGDKFGEWSDATSEKIAREGLTKKAKPNEIFGTAVNKNINVLNKNFSAKNFVENQNKAFDLLVDNVKEGKIKKPESIVDVIDGIDTSKKQVFGEITKLMDEAGTTIDLNNVGNEFLKFLDKEIELGTNINQNEINRLFEEISSLTEKGEVSPQLVNDLIVRYGDEVKTRGQKEASATFTNGLKAIRQLLSDELDKAISNTPNEAKNLRSKYAALKAIEEPMYKAYAKDFKKQKFGGLEIMQGAEEVADYLKGNPISAAGRQLFNKTANLTRNPDFQIKVAFDEALKSK